MTARPRLSWAALMALFSFAASAAPSIDMSQVKGKQVLLVVGHDDASDDALIAEHLASLGIVVTLAGEDDPVDRAAGMDLVMISSTVNSRVHGRRFRSTALPVLTWNAYSYPDLGMTGERLHHDFSVVREAVQHQENHANFYAWGVNPTHEISRAAGLEAGMFLPIFFVGETDMNWGRPTLGADTLVTFKGDPTQAALFVYEQGATMTGGFDAPARRVGIFLGDDTFHQLSDAQGPAAQDPKERAWFAGRRLFDAALRWALTSPVRPAKEPTALGAALRKAAAGKRVLFVRRLDLPWPAGETSVPQNAAFLDSLGFQVTIRDHMESDEVASDYDLVIVTAAINKFKFANKYADAPVPVILMETKNVDAMNLVGPGRTVEYGTNDHKDSLYPPENYVSIVRASHPMSGPFPSGLLKIYDAPGVMGWSQPPPAAIVIATIPNQPDHAAVFGYEKGALMAFNTIAPARRAVFPLDFPMFVRLTDAGRTLYKALLLWSISEPD